MNETLDEFITSFKMRRKRFSVKKIIPIKPGRRGLGLPGPVEAIAESKCSGQINNERFEFKIDSKQ